MAIAVVPAAATPRRRLYVALSVLMAVIAAVGFWPRYYGPLVEGRLAQPALIHVHAIVFTGWLALFATQVLLAARRQLRWHLRLGRIGIVYGVLLVGVGLYTTVARSALLARGGAAEGLLYVGMCDMVFFAAFFGAAAWFRRTPQVHKRLMTVAAAMLLVAAVGRMTFLPPPPGGLPLMLLIWSSPVLIGMAVDWRQERRIHPAYLAGLAAFAARLWSEPLALTRGWAAVSRWMLG